MHKTFLEPWTDSELSYHSKRLDFRFAVALPPPPPPVVVRGSITVQPEFFQFPKRNVRLGISLSTDFVPFLEQEKVIHLFAGRAVKRERRKGSSRRQQPAYGAAVNEVARELLRRVRSPKRENGGRRYIKHDGMIASPVGSCLCC